jgi:hypothetical protein
MRAISSVNLLKNSIGIDQAEALVSMLKEHPTLKSLCGNKGNETELDMSGKMRSSEDAIMLAAEITGNGALSTLNLMDTGLTHGARKAYPGQYSAGNDGFRVEAEWGTKDSDFDTDMLGIIALANAIPDMRALTSLDISDNKLARGAYKGGDTFDDASYETDTTGMRVCVAPKLFSDAMTLQVLQPLPMPSVTMGR